MQSFLGLHALQLPFDGNKICSKKSDEEHESLEGEDNLWGKYKVKSMILINYLVGKSNC